MPKVLSNTLQPSAGGSQILERYLRDNLKLQQCDQEKINIIVSNTSPRLISPEKINILWNHYHIDQPNVIAFRSKEYMEQYDLIVFVSHWQFQRYLENFDLPQDRCIVIQNAIEDITDPTKKIFGKKIKLIYASTPWRGLELLLDCFELLDNEEIELDVFSSTKIYGSEFHDENEKDWSHLFDRASQIPGVNYRGFVSNKDVRAAMQEAHILSYPSYWAETSCLTAIEAGLSGLNLVVTNYGALPETCGPFANYVQFSRDYSTLLYSYTYGLEKVIKYYWEPSNQEKLKKQREYFKDFWTWNSRLDEWRDTVTGLINAKNHDKNSKY
jgi:glycosyltransferase involved in cell wall biosynthesis